MTDPLPAPAQTMSAAITSYRGYVNGKLDMLTGQVLTLKASIGNNDLDAARRQWLDAQLTWQRVGAAYGSFGELGDAINGLPNGLPKGTSDPGFTGLHRIEFGLYNGQGPGQLTPVAATLLADIDKLRGQLNALTIDPTDLPIRCHEILEDSLRDNLSGNNDQGSGMALALTAADVDGTRVVLAILGAMINRLHPGYAATVSTSVDRLANALAGTRTDGQWPVYRTAALSVRQPVTGALGAALELLAFVPVLFSSDD